MNIKERWEVAGNPFEVVEEAEDKGKAKELFYTLLLPLKNYLQNVLNGCERYDNEDPRIASVFKALEVLDLLDSDYAYRIEFLLDKPIKEINVEKDAFVLWTYAYRCLGHSVVYWENEPEKLLALCEKHLEYARIKDRIFNKSNIQKIKLVSEAFSMLPPEPGEEVKQVLTIKADGATTLTRYFYDSECEKRRYQKKIALENANSILMVFELMLLLGRKYEWATDSGLWNIKAEFVDSTIEEDCGTLGEYGYLGTINVDKYLRELLPYERLMLFSWLKD